MLFVGGTAVVVDDMAMEISHIIRAEEHLPTTPKAILLWEALGGPPLPTFAHVPVLVNEKSRSSPSGGDRVAVEDYRDSGYLPEAMRNHLELLGWGPGDERKSSASMSAHRPLSARRCHQVSRLFR